MLGEAVTPDFVRKARVFGLGPPVGVLSASRRVTAWLAVFCLYIQLAASAACVVGAPEAALAGPEQGLFPICHALVGGEDAGRTHNRGGVPAHRHSCPFCSIHCHAAAAVTPTIVVFEPSLVLSASVEPPLFVVRSSVRFPAGAPPRGPPSAG